MIVKAGKEMAKMDNWQLLKVEPSYQIVVAKGVKRKPTLDFDHEDVERISKKIVEELSKIPNRKRIK